MESGLREGNGIEQKHGRESKIQTETDLEADR